MSNWLKVAWCVMGILWTCDVILWIVRFVSPSQFTWVMQHVLSW